MPYQTSTYAGDADHPICCTGDAVVGDRIAFERATFCGSLRRPKFAGFELVTGTIVADSYGAADRLKSALNGCKLHRNYTGRPVLYKTSSRRTVIKTLDESHYATIIIHMDSAKSGPPPRRHRAS